MLACEVHLPIGLLLGVSPRHPQELETSLHESVVDLHERMADICQLVKQHLQKTGERQKFSYDTRLAYNSHQAGDLVYSLDTTKKLGQNPKLRADIWQGPGIIIKRFSDLLSEVKLQAKERSKILHQDKQPSPRFSRPFSCKHGAVRVKWGSPSASDPRAKIRANVPPKGPC